MIEVTTITPAGEDDRGFTAEFEQKRTGTHLIVYRRAGTISGRHYHKGISDTKNPEILTLLSGSCTLKWKHIDSDELQSEQYSAPVQLTIPPLVWHEITADTDCTFVEQNSIEEHVADTFRL